jgi:hypothetical protein
MPTVLRVAGYRFFMYSNEGREPPHIHVQKAEGLAKFWLNPISLASTTGFQRKQLNQLEEIIQEHHRELLEAWNEYFA